MHQQPYAGALRCPPRGPRRSNRATRSGQQSGVKGYTDNSVAAAMSCALPLIGVRPERAPGVYRPSFLTVGLSDCFIAGQLPSVECAARASTAAVVVVVPFS